MNVLFLQPALPLYRIPFFERLQANHPWSVTVWSDHDSLLHANTVSPSFSSLHRPERRVGAFLSQPALLEAVRSNWADVVVLSWNTRYLHLLPALLEARRRGKPVILWGHGYSKNERPVLRRLRNRLGRLATACIVYSEATRAQLLTEGFCRERVFCAPNALHDAPLFDALTADSVTGLGERARTQYGCGERTVLFVSRLEPDKQPMLLLDAFDRVRTEVVDARLVIVGDGSERATMHRRVQSLGLSDVVTLTGAIYAERELAPLFVKSRVFAYPTAIGLSLLHAFSYGLPVVTARAPERHNPEFEALVPNVNGLVYDDGDVDDFARQVVRVLTEPSLRTTLSQGALRAVRPPHGKTLSAMASGMHSALEFAAGRGRR